MKYDIYISGSIGWPFSAQWVRQELAAYKGKPCTVYLNSLGGSVTDALDIYQQFRDHGDVTVRVFGLTASAATIVACGARRVEMSAHALLLIHQASDYADVWGRMNADDIRAAIRELEKSEDMLRKVDGIIANIYAARSGGKAADFRDLMRSERWMTAEEAKGHGLIDAIVEEGAEPDLTDKAILARVQACALPAPQGKPGQAGGGAEVGGFARGVRRVLSGLGIAAGGKDGAADATPAGGKDNANQANQGKKIMDDKKEKMTLAALCALLAVETLAAADDGTVRLTAAQAAAVEKFVAGAQAQADGLERENKRLADENASLAEQVKNLEAADGDETARTEGKTADGDDAPGSTACAMYAKFRTLL